APGGLQALVTRRPPGHRPALEGRGELVGRPALAGELGELAAGGPLEQLVPEPLVAAQEILGPCLGVGLAHRSTSTDGSMAPACDPASRAVNCLAWYDHDVSIRRRPAYPTVNTPRGRGGPRRRGGPDGPRSGEGARAPARSAGARCPITSLLDGDQGHRVDQAVGQHEVALVR